MIFAIFVFWPGRESYRSSGYQPMLNFTVEDYEAYTSKLASYGASQDGQTEKTNDFTVEFLCSLKNR